MNEEARARAQELANHFNSLPALLPPPPPPVEAVEKYDDAQVQEKLDKLIGQVSEAEKSTAQLERLDEIHKQVLATAAEVSDFVAKQTQLITDDNEAKEREAEEVALLLERRLAQKEQLEADIDGLKAEKERVVQELKEEKERAMAELREEKEATILELREEKNSLLAAVAALQAERENLANQKVRLTGFVAHCARH
jgi:DNA repair exonuclease SbcCD ATPase subunit